MNLGQIYYQLRANFWLIPAVMVVGALLLAYGLVALDQVVDAQYVSPWLPGPRMTPDGGQQIVSTIAGSTITVASLVFSLVFIALTLMSQQLGPRVLVFFMTDRTTQLVMGFFIATFIYALLVLGSFSAAQPDGFTPRISIGIAVIMAIFDFCLVIYFVHHMARSLQADQVVSRLGAELITAIDKVIVHADRPAGSGTGEDARDEETHRREMESSGGAEICAPCAGYIQSIDFTHAATIAQREGIEIRFAARPGHFVHDGSTLARAVGLDPDNDDIAAELCRCIVIGERRTQAQYAEFELNALVEVALRALSPGINDPYTAIACINQITNGLVHILTREERSPVLTDDDGAILVRRYPQDFRHFIDTAFHGLRSGAAARRQVLMHLIGALGTLSQYAQRKCDREAVGEHIDIFAAEIEQSIAIEPDRAALIAALDGARAGRSG